jgi:hypothetical protein
MKIDPIELEHVKRVVKCATNAKIDNLVIEPGKIRGIDDDQTIILFHTEDVPQFSFGSLGLNRISTFVARFDLAANISGTEVSVETETDKNGQLFARALNIKGKGIKIDYRCANPAVIRAPRKFVDIVTYHVDMSPDVLFFMTKGQSAMASKEVTLTCKNSVTMFTITDVNGDELQYEFPLNAKDINNPANKSVEFTYSYSLTTLLPLLKNVPDQPFCITAPTGMIKLTIDGFDVYIMPVR